MRRLVERDGCEMPVVHQCELLGVKRGSVYYSPSAKPESKEHMDRIDELFTEDPTCGTRRIRGELRKRHGIVLGRGKIRSLMRRMGLHAIYRRVNTSKPHPGHRKYPYLLRGVKVTHPNQVWSTDITYIKLRGGFVYLCAVIDWYSRYVLSWRLSTSLDSGFCIEAVQEAIARHGTPEIFNTDQGCQFTSEAFTGVLKGNGIAISMDGRGRALDNVFVERLWRTVKHDDIYIRGYATVRECSTGLAEFFHRYNEKRAHSALDYNTPREIYLGLITLQVAA